jgi:hypothetical protein
MYIPFILEMYRLTLLDDIKDRKTVHYFALMFGFSIAFKLTSAIFAVVLLLIFIIRNYKQIYIKDYFISFMLCILPSSIYLLYSYIGTGNPVFPFYNGIFNSSYIAADNFKDMRWGPKTIIEYITWPLYIFFHPDRTSELSVYSGRLTIGVISIVTYIVFSIFNKQQRSKNAVYSVIFLLLSTFLWVVSTGYIRYALFLEIIAGVFIVLTSLNYVKSKNSGMRLIGHCLIIMLLIQSFYSISLVTISNKDWSWRSSLLTNSNEYVKNASMLFKDRGKSNDKILEDVDAWIITNFYCSYPLLLKDNIPILNINWNLMPSASAKKEFIDYYDKLGSKKVFTVCDSSNFDNTLNMLYTYGLEIKSLRNVSPSFLPFGNTLQLLEIGKRSNNEIEKGSDSEINLVRNHSFEETIDNVVVGWNASNVGMQLINNKLGAKTGDFYIRASVNDPFTQQIIVDPTKIYKLNFYSKADNENENLTRLQINWYDDEKFIDCTIKVVESKLEWSEFSIMAMPPAGANNAVIYICSHEKYYVNFDDISFSAQK